MVSLSKALCLSLALLVAYASATTQVRKETPEEACIPSLNKCIRLLLLQNLRALSYEDAAVPAAEVVQVRTNSQIPC